MKANEQNYTMVTNPYDGALMEVAPYKYTTKEKAESDCRRPITEGKAFFARIIQHNFADGTVKIIASAMMKVESFSF